MANNPNSSNSTFTILKPGEKNGNEVNEKKVLFTSVVSQELKANQNQEMDIVNENNENEKEQNSK